MSRFVRASKYRHVFGQPAKKEHGLENVKVTNSAWDTNVVAASGEYLSINWNASGGGAFAIVPLPSPFAATPGFTYKLPDSLPLARSHTAPVLDTDWSPHNDKVVASAGEDGKVMVWKVEPENFEGWGAEGWVPTDFDPVARIDASPRKVGQVLFHPTAQNVLASASGEHVVKLWDLAAPEAPRLTLTGHADAIQSLAFSPSGTLLATTSRDRKLRLFDPRVGGGAVRTAEGHGGIKGARVVFIGPDRLATTGFSKMSDRQVSLWDTADLRTVKTVTLDQSAGVVMPFWSENGILFLGGKGDGNIRYFEYEADALHPLSEHKSSDPQRGMCFLPRRALNVGECEIARAYKVTTGGAGGGGTVEPIAFIVPRKADSFQSDIFPPAPSIEPSLSAAEFFAGKEAPIRLVSLEDGVSFAGKAAAPQAYTPQAQQAPVQPKVEPTRTYTAPAPEPVARQSSVDSYSAPSPAERTPSYSSYSSPAPTPAAPAQQDSALAEENARLNTELREAYAKIRGLELELEGVRANARRAAQALLEG